MARNVQLLVLRGTQANIPGDLALGELYFATDTNQLFFGTPGVGIGYIQIGDTRKVNETLNKILLVMESIRRAMVAIACEGGRCVPADFDTSLTSATEEGTDFGPKV